MPEIKQTLKNFGLTENEVEVYLLLLKIGNSSASEIASKTDIHRINVYDILERLQEKGLVSFVIIGKRKSYEAVNPKKILEIEEERKKEIEQIVPELIKQTKTAKIPHEVTVFKDKAGIRNIANELTKVKEFCFLASGQGFLDYFGKINYEIWHAKLKLNNVKVRCLISKKFKGVTKFLKPISYRYLPSEFVFPSTTLLYEDKVLIIMWSSNPVAILIRSQSIYNSYKNYFELLWKVSKR